MGRPKKSESLLPDNQMLWVTVKTESNNKYYITSNKDRSLYYLYQDKNDTIVQIAKSVSPLAFEKYYK